MENTQLSNSRTNKELENELKFILIKKREINLSLKKLTRKENHKLSVLNFNLINLEK